MPSRVVALLLFVLLLIAPPGMVAAAVVESGPQNLGFDFFAASRTELDLDADGVVDFELGPGVEGGIIDGVHSQNRVVAADEFFEPTRDVAKLATSTTVSASCPSAGQPGFCYWDNVALFRYRPPQGTGGPLWAIGEETFVASASSAIRAAARPSIMDGSA